ncbi:MAG: hypothetical protein ACLP05_06845 [Candidatus Kryptoniota bacterium]
MLRIDVCAIEAKMSYNQTESKRHDNKSIIDAKSASQIAVPR